MLKHWQLVPEKRTPHMGSDAAREMAAADDEGTLIKDGAHVHTDTHTHTQAQIDRDKKKKSLLLDHMVILGRGAKVLGFLSLDGEMRPKNRDIKKKKRQNGENSGTNRNGWPDLYGK